jgi:hypothetical protein
MTVKDEEESGTALADATAAYHRDRRHAGNVSINITPELRTRLSRTQPRTSRQGRARTPAGLRLRSQPTPPPTYSLTTCDLMSHFSRQQCATRQGQDQGPGARLIYGLKRQGIARVGGQPAPDFRAGAAFPQGYLD